MMAGMWVRYQGHTYQIGEISGPARGYAGMPEPDRYYSLADPDDPAGPWLRVANPTADQIAPLPPCEVCGHGGRHGGRCEPGCPVGMETRAARLDKETAA